MKNGDAGHLMLTQAHISRLAVASIVALVFVFIAGYYMGKKSQSEELAEHIQREALADRIYSSMYTLYPMDDKTDGKEELSNLE